MLFTMNMLHRVTGDVKWRTMYLAELEKRGGEKQLSKRAICVGGMVIWYSKNHNWTSRAGVGVWAFLELAHGNALFGWGMPRPLAPGAFYSLISMMGLVNGMTAIQAWRQRRLERVG